MNEPTSCVKDAAAAAGVVAIAGSVGAGDAAGNHPPSTASGFARAAILLGVVDGAAAAAWVTLVLSTPEGRGRGGIVLLHEFSKNTHYGWIVNTPQVFFGAWHL